MKAAVIGGSGAVGTHILSELLASDAYESVLSIGRRPNRTLGPETEEVVVDFQNLQSRLQSINADHAYCSLGTTIKKAGSKEAFARVDHGYVLDFARGIESQAQRFALVSSVGASPKSKSFYLRTKGEVEQALSALDFESVVVARPGVLLTKRKEPRPGERLAIALTPLYNPLLQGGLRKYRGIEASAVARALVAAMTGSPVKFQILENSDLIRLAS